MTRRWSPAEDRAVTKRWRAGASAVEISAEFGRTPDAVRSRVKLLGICRWVNTPVSPEEIEFLVDAFRRNEPIDVIAQQVGRGESTVRAHIKRLGLTRPRLRTRKTKRECMCCGRVFLSWGNGNRLCSECREKSPTILGHPYDGVLAA